MKVIKDNRADYKYAGCNNCRFIQRYDNIMIGKLNWRGISVSDLIFCKTTNGKEKAQARVGSEAK